MSLQNSAAFEGFLVRAGLDDVRTGDLRYTFNPMEAECTILLSLMSPTRKD